MRIFLTGATGVVGRRLVPVLLNASHEVTAAVRSTVARAELTGPISGFGGRRAFGRSTATGSSRTTRSQFLWIRRAAEHR